MRRRAATFMVALTAVVAMSFGTATAAPAPITFCLPDLDGHCRYCEIRFAPISMGCLGG